MKKSQNFKDSKGITLVALVVTIVVLLILAGVSINLVLGENGLIAKAKEARNAVRDDNENILIGMNNLYDEMEAAINGETTGENGGSDENPGGIEDPNEPVVDPYEGQTAKTTFEIGKENPLDVIAYLYLKENGNYDLVVRGTGTGEMMSFGETYAECGASCTTIFSDYKLENVYITSGVTNIGNAMFNHLSLNEVHIANTITTIGDGAFSFATISNDIIIPESVEYIGMGAFCCCNANITLLNENVFLKAGVFNNLQGGKELTNTKIIIKEGTDVLEKYVLYDCNNLKEVVIPNSVTSIELLAFGYCTSLTSITIPASVTNIGRSAFSGCTSLTNITIPASVTSIPNQAFYNCTSLTDVYYAGSEDDWKAIAIGSYNDPLTNATIHYNSTGPDSN